MACTYGRCPFESPKIPATFLGRFVELHWCALLDSRGTSPSTTFRYCVWNSSFFRHRWRHLLTSTADLPSANRTRRNEVQALKHDVTVGVNFGMSFSRPSLSESPVDRSLYLGCNITLFGRGATFLNFTQKKCPKCYPNVPHFSLHFLVPTAFLRKDTQMCPIIPQQYVFMTIVLLWRTAFFYPFRNVRTSRM